MMLFSRFMNILIYLFVIVDIVSLRRSSYNNGEGSFETGSPASVEHSLSEAGATSISMAALREDSISISTKTDIIEYSEKKNKKP